MCLLQALGIGATSHRESEHSRQSNEVLVGGRSWSDLTFTEKAKIVACVAGVAFVILMSLALLAGSILIAIPAPLFWIVVVADLFFCFSMCAGTIVAASNCIDRIYNKPV